MPLPPWSEVWDVLRLVLAPALGAALVVMLVVRGLGGERLAPLAAALALAVGILAGNHFREAFLWQLESERPLNDKDFRTVLAQALEPEPSTETAEGEEEPPPRQSPRYWLIWLTLLALAVELLARLPAVTPAPAWIARTLVAVLAGRLLTPPDIRVEMAWSSWALALLILSEWALLTHLARQWKDGTVPASLALSFQGAAVVILYAGSASLVDLPLMLFAALVAIAALAWWMPGDTGGAVAGAVIFLPGYLLNCQQETFSKVPWYSFALVGAAPLCLTLLLIPAWQRQQGWKRWLPGIGLPFVPAAVAVARAAQVETLPF